MLGGVGKKQLAASVTSEMMTKQRRYEALVRALHADLYRYAFWLCHNPTVADDLVQETFLRAWKSLDSLKDEGAAKAWLITILRRENARRFERKQFDLSDLDEVQVADPAQGDPEQTIEQRWLRRQIAQLEPEYREPLLLQILYGFSGDEIATVMELNRNTVMTRLFRARNQLREAMQDNAKTGGQKNG
ncbi:sigma-70 family RNA polymerase sigma factor [Ferrimonas gelatinilytica]|uniref:RNA polymerase sigma factor n=1 Tax=Ferrimonas gelatinilytica TaxID=1255257 RepID=A0ABP9S6L1_9GAMM